MKTLTKLLLSSIAMAVIAGCSWFHRPIDPVVTKPVEVQVIEVRYVPIDSRLTRPLDALPTPLTFGQLWDKAEAGDALKAAADARFACIATVQGTKTTDPPPDCTK